MYHYGNPGDIGTNGLDDRVSWTERFNPAGRDKTSLELDVINYTPKRGLGSSMAYLSDKEGKDNEHTDGKVASEAIQLMEKHKDEPFFIAAGFYKPHCPWITPKKYFDMYKPDQMKLPEISEETPKLYPEPASSFNHTLAIFRNNVRSGTGMQTGLLRSYIICRCTDRKVT